MAPLDPRDGSLVLDGTVPVAELREAHGIPIPESAEFESVAGFMLERLGTVTLTHLEDTAQARIEDTRQKLASVSGGAD